jgi:hypothetical protein
MAVCKPFVSFNFFLRLNPYAVYKLVRFYQPASQEQYLTTRATLTVFSRFLSSPSNFVVAQSCVAKPLSLFFCCLAHLLLVSAASPTLTGAYNLLKSMVSPMHLYLWKWMYSTVINSYSYFPAIQVLKEHRFHRKHDSEAIELCGWRPSRSEDFHRVNLQVGN